ncbi:MAG: hypothetical protein AVDCRST_MAG28-2205, partial [uncultured Rubrobacteraceae bacterium]
DPGLHGRVQRLRGAARRSSAPALGRFFDTPGYGSARSGLLRDLPWHFGLGAGDRRANPDPPHARAYPERRRARPPARADPMVPERTSRAQGGPGGELYSDRGDSGQLRPPAPRRDPSGPHAVAPAVGHLGLRVGAPLRAQGYAPAGWGRYRRNGGGPGLRVERHPEQRRRRRCAARSRRAAPQAPHDRHCSLRPLEHCHRARGAPNRLRVGGGADDPGNSHSGADSLRPTTLRRILARRHPPTRPPGRRHPLRPRRDRHTLHLPEPRTGQAV